MIKLICEGYFPPEHFAAMILVLHIAILDFHIWMTRRSIYYPATTGTGSAETLMGAVGNYYYG